MVMEVAAKSRSKWEGEVVEMNRYMMVMGYW